MGKEIDRPGAARASASGDAPPPGPSASSAPRDAVVLLARQYTALSAAEGEHAVVAALRVHLEGLGLLKLDGTLVGDVRRFLPESKELAARIGQLRASHVIPDVISDGKQSGTERAHRERTRGKRKPGSVSQALEPRGGAATSAQPNLAAPARAAATSLLGAIGGGKTVRAAVEALPPAVRNPLSVADGAALTAALHRELEQGIGRLERELAQAKSRGAPDEQLATLRDRLGCLAMERQGLAERVVSLVSGDPGVDLTALPPESGARAAAEMTRPDRPPPAATERASRGAAAAGSSPGPGRGAREVDLEPLPPPPGDPLAAACLEAGLLAADVAALHAFCARRAVPRGELLDIVQAGTYRGAELREALVAYAVLADACNGSRLDEDTAGGMRSFVLPAITAGRVRFAVREPGELPTSWAAYDHQRNEVLLRAPGLDPADVRQRAAWIHEAQHVVQDARRARADRYAFEEDGHRAAAEYLLRERGVLQERDGTLHVDAAALESLWALGLDAPDRHQVARVYAAAVDDILASGELGRFRPPAGRDEIRASLDRPTSSFREVYLQAATSMSRRSGPELDAELSRVYAKQGLGR